MVCLFVAWTPLGGGEIESDGFLVQLIGLLALFLFLANQFVVNPIIRGMLKTKFDPKTYFDQPLFKRLMHNLLSFLRMLVITIAIWAIYVAINLSLDAIGFGNPSGRPSLMLEPITFGIFYGFLYLFWDWAEAFLARRFARKGAIR
ncbi:MAG: hypothetical protein MZU97_26215 [Bacillus subtilis]|nr:hypothetical protein [Bacillus subtilis]